LSGRRVLVTGVEDAVGQLVARRMAARGDLVIGVAEVAGTTADGMVEVVGVSRDYAGIAELLQRREIDTIVHAYRPRTEPGTRADGAGEHVIATMQLAAAAAHRAAPVRRVVMASSTGVYPASARAPLLYPESEPLQPRRGSWAASMVEAEGFMRDLATANPNLSVSILRLGDLVGPGADDPLGLLLRRPVAPVVWGFDPPVQLLHLNDAVAAFEHALDRELAGIYNVAGDGLVRWRRAVRLAGRTPVELPAVPTRTLDTALRWSYRINTGDDTLAMLRYGRAGATDAFSRCGFRPVWTTEQCVPRSSTWGAFRGR
jgi:UDP-glucose 4-epimerase